MSRTKHLAMSKKEAEVVQLLGKEITTYCGQLFWL